jgi:hypothetical protein
LAIPTRFIDDEEFHELMRQEGDVLPLFKLSALPFNPPRPGDPYPDPEEVSVNVLLVNVAEPCLYRDKDMDMAFILMNAYDQDETFTYDNFQDCHIIKRAWAYRLSPAYWQELDPHDEYDLDDAVYCFAPSDIPTWREPGD